MDSSLRRMTLSDDATSSGSVRLVPSIGERLWRRARFDCALNDVEEAIAGRLPRDRRATVAVGPDVVELFRACDDAFASALRVIAARFSGVEYGPRSAPFALVDALARWAAARGARARASLASVAFLVAADQKSGAFVKLVVGAYRLRERARDLAPLVRELVDEADYRAACQWAVALDARDEFDVEELLVPLLLQDRTAQIDELLAGGPKRALELARYVDGLLGAASVARAARELVARLRVPDAKVDKLDAKPLSKFVARLCKKHDLPISACENFARKRAVDGVRYLIRQRYERCKLSDDVWNEMIADALADNPGVLEEFVDSLSFYDEAEARAWAARYGLPVERVARKPARHAGRDEYAFEPSCDDDDFDSSDSGDAPGPSRPIARVKTLPRPRPKVEFVDSELAFFERAAPELLTPTATVVGIDSEWKPSFGAKPSCVSLVQIATPSSVYVLDAIALSGSRAWPPLVDRLLGNPDVIKLGFGVDNDLREISGSVRGLERLRRDGAGFVELSRLWRNCVDAGVEPPHGKRADGEGLNSIVEQCFDSSLDKTEQCSNWENRPLRDSQLEYAALDAYVLVEIYGLLETLCRKRGLDFDELCYRSSAGGPDGKRRRRRK